MLAASAQSRIERGAVACWQRQTRNLHAVLEKLLIGCWNIEPSEKARP